MQDLIQDLINIITQYYSIIAPLLFLGIQLLVLFVIYLFVTRGAKRRLRSLGLSSEASTGLVIILRVLFFVVAILLVANIIGEDSTTVLSLSTLFGTALGLAFSKAAGSIISGLYVFISRPFHVGDYVRIGDKEGIVTDITLNFTMIRQPDETRLRIPNNKVLESDITNFRVKLKDVIKDINKERLATSEIEKRSALTRVLTRLRAFTYSSYGYMYTFDIRMNAQFDHIKIRENFEKMCNKWEETFLTKPDYQVWDTSHVAIIYRFTVFVSEPEDLLMHIADFMDDLLLPYRT